MSESVTIEQVAKGAYEAYGKVTDFKNFQGNPMPAFEELPKQIQTAWIYASNEAIRLSGWLER